jgi:hypothetical protein
MTNVCGEGAVFGPEIAARWDSDIFVRSMFSPPSLHCRPATRSPAVCLVTVSMICTLRAQALLVSICFSYLLTYLLMVHITTLWAEQTGMSIYFGGPHPRHGLSWLKSFVVCLSPSGTVLRLRDDTSFQILPIPDSSYHPMLYSMFLKRR